MHLPTGFDIYEEHEKGKRWENMNKKMCTFIQPSFTPFYWGCDQIVGHLAQSFSVDTRSLKLRLQLQHHPLVISIGSDHIRCEGWTTGLTSPNILFLQSLQLPLHPLLLSYLSVPLHSLSTTLTFLSFFISSFLHPSSCYYCSRIVAFSLLWEDHEQNSSPFSCPFTPFQVCSVHLSFLTLSFLFHSFLLVSLVFPWDIWTFRTLYEVSVVFILWRWDKNGLMCKGVQDWVRMG